MISRQTIKNNNQSELLKVAIPSYAVITPVRDEAKHIEKIIESMLQQTVRPSEWVVVNDGSTDETDQIVSIYIADNPWIKLISRRDRGNRQRGKGVVEAFYDGYKSLKKTYDFIVKLDGDLSFEADYFEKLFREFIANANLGIAGGAIYERLDGEHWVLRSSSDHVRGPTKVYRQTCFEAIGGLMPSLGWDGIDEWKALSMGWEVRTFFNLKVFHYRATGAATGRIKSRVEEGQGAYYMNYHPLFLIARGIHRMFEKPYFIGGFAMILAYFMAFFQSRERFSDPTVVLFIRRTQLRKLMGLLVGRPVHELK